MRRTTFLLATYLLSVVLGSSSYDLMQERGLQTASGPSSVPGTTTYQTTSKTNSKDDNPWGLFVLGLALIPFSLALIWKNEKKIVRYHQVIKQAKKVVKKDQDYKEVNEANEKALVHMRGKTRNQEGVKDGALDYGRPDVYRIIRTVEMFQRVEHKHESDDTTTYTYSNEWTSLKVSDAHFENANERGHNPTVAWPFESKTTEAETVQFGAYHLSKDQIRRCKGNMITETWDDTEGQREKTLEKLKETRGSFAPFEVHGEYLYSTAAEGQQVGSEHIGSFRVKVVYATCGDLTVMAQQIYNPTDSVWTFRKWNPDKKGAAYGENVDADDLADVGACRTACCLCCVLVGKCMNTVFEEVVDELEEKHQGAKDMLKASDKFVQKMGCCFRPLGVLLSFLGWYFLFAPTISFLNWIPLIGKLLGWVASAVAALVGCICGVQNAMLVMAIAWLRFHPLWGILLLVGFGLGIASIFIIPAYIDSTPE